MADRIIETETVYVPVDQYTPEEIEEKCCEIVSMDPCAKSGKKIEPWSSLSTEDLSGELQALSDAAQNDPLLEVRFENIGKPCGVQETRYSGSLGCCDDAPSFFFTKTVDVVLQGSTYVFCVGGGVPPYSWSVDESGLYIGGSDSCATLIVSDCFCAPGRITVVDACGQSLDHWVSSTNGSYVHQDPGVYPPYIVPNGVSVGSGQGIDGEDGVWRVSQRWGSVSSQTGDIEELCNFAEGNPRFNQYVRLGDLGEWTECTNTNSIWRWNPELERYEARWPIEFDLDIWKWKCPSEPDDLLVDEINSAEVITDNHYGTIFIVGGKPPFVVSVSGQGFWTDSGRSRVAETISINNFKVYTSEACGVCDITITDNCGSVVTGSVESDNGAC